MLSRKPGHNIYWSCPHRFALGALLTITRKTLLLVALVTAQAPVSGQAPMQESCVPQPLQVLTAATNTQKKTLMAQLMVRSNGGACQPSREATNWRSALRRIAEIGYGSSTGLLEARAVFCSDTDRGGS